MLTALVALALAAVTQQQSMSASSSAAASCPAVPVAPPPELAGWSSPVPVGAAISPEKATAAMLPLGKSVRGTLHPNAILSPAVKSSHVPAAGSEGGLFAFAVTEPGRYRIALDGAAWIDVVNDGQAVESIAHGHGPNCSGIRKTVDFSLQPGRYLLQVSASTTPMLRVLVARVSG